jgi:hypothetical protein
MTHLVGNHIGLGEITRSTVTPFAVFKKGQVDVDLAICRAVKRPHRGTGHAAGRRDRTGEQQQPRFLVGTPGLPEDCMPGILGIRQYHGDKIHELCLPERGLIVTFDGRLCEVLLQLQQHLRVDTEEIGYRQGQYDSPCPPLNTVPPTVLRPRRSSIFELLRPVFQRMTSPR